MPSVTTLISRAAARYFGIGPPTFARGLARVAARELGDGPGHTAQPVPRPATRLARGLYLLWLSGIGLFVLVVMNVDLLLPDSTTSVFRLGVGAMLLTEGAGLLVKGSRFRIAVSAALTARFGLHTSRMRRTAWKHTIGTGLTVLGLAWVGAGVLDMLRGAIEIL